MAEATEQERRKSKRTAAKAVAVVAAFALAFVGVCAALDRLAPRTPVTSLVPTGAAPASENPEGDATIDGVQDPLYVLLIGSDSRKGTALYTGKASDHAQLDQHSDIMTLVRVDPATYTVTLVTVPRDTVLAGESRKINDALTSGDPEQVVDKVEQLTGVGVDYYMLTTFTAFEDLIDALGGVVVDVPKTVKVPDPSTAESVTVKAGDDQELDGSETLVLARARKEYGENQDALRQVNVRNIEQAIIGKVLSAGSERQIDAMLFDLRRYTDTNIDFAELAPLAVDFVLHAGDVTVYSCTGPYQGGENDDGLWVVPEDKEAWARLMAAVDAGEDPVPAAPVQPSHG